MHIDTEEQLEDKLSQPSPDDIAAMRALQGDILILGVGGKMGPSLARLMQRSIEAAGVQKNIVAVARFTDPELPATLQKDGIKTITADLLDDGALDRLPDVPNVIFMAARKFGTTGAEYLSWAMNTQLPALVASRYRNSRIVCFSSGNVYPLRPLHLGGAVEETPADARGEYAQSVLGRERIFEYGSHRWGTPVTLLRLNYAVDLRYGVLSDIGTTVFQRQPLDIRTPALNAIWQRDANSVCFRTLEYCQSPPFVLNLTGPETLSIRWIAEEFGRHFGCEPIFAGEETNSAYLSNAAKQHQLFGYPTVTPNQMIAWTAHWIAGGKRNLNKPTHFQTRDGKY